MLNFAIKKDDGAPLRVLCLGAHSDDIEIGCGGTVLKLIEERPSIEFHWVVFSATEVRRREAEESAAKLLHGAKARTVVVKDFRDGFFPYTAIPIKEYFEQLKSEWSPDLVFTHHRNDMHQDHRTISELTWNTFRDHLILEYEILKYDGDFGSPNVFSYLTERQGLQKVRCILSTFTSQEANHWFNEEAFLSVLRLRGVESNAPTSLAEGFYCRKLVLAG